MCQDNRYINKDFYHPRIIVDYYFSTIPGLLYSLITKAVHLWKNAFRIPASYSRDACLLPAAYSEISLSSESQEVVLWLVSLWCLQHLPGCPAHEDETSEMSGSRLREECAGVVQRGGQK